MAAFDIGDGAFVQLSGRNSRKATGTGTSARASVSDTSVWQLALLPSIEAYCGGDPDGMLSLLRQGCIIDHKECIACPDHPVRLMRQFQPERLIIPHAIGNEMMKAIVLTWSQEGGHRLNALAISGAKKAGDVKRAHGAALPAPETIDKLL